MAAIKFCPECGREFGATDKFCAGCGIARTAYQKVAEQQAEKRVAIPLVSVYNKSVRRGSDDDGPSSNTCAYCYKPCYGRYCNEGCSRSDHDL